MGDEGDPQGKPQRDRAAPLFRCKGNVRAGLLQHIEGSVRGGLTAVLDAADSDLRDFASQRFLAASWYDALWIAPLGETAAFASGVPYTQLMSDFGVAQAERDIRGVYQVLLRLASPAMVVDRLPRAAKQYFDFVTSELLTRPTRSPADLLVTGIPRQLAPVYLLVTEPFLRRALTLAGAKDVDVTVSKLENDARVGGVTTVRFTRCISWT